MTVLVTVLGGFSSYAGIVSAYCFVRPALQVERTRTVSELLETTEAHPNPDVAKLAKELRLQADSSLAKATPRRNCWNAAGFVLLVVSAALLGGAVVVDLSNQTSERAAPAG